MLRLTFIPLFLAILWLPGCAAITAASIIPGSVYKVVATQFDSEEKSFPQSTRTTLAAVQSSLNTMKLKVNVLEIQEGGYAIAFGDDNINGSMTLKSMTAKLTIVSVQVRRNLRELSIEQAIIKSIQKNLTHMNTKHHFRFAGYANLRSKPDIKTEKLGWYRQRASLNTHRNGDSKWLSLKLPSGKTAYLKNNTMKAQYLALRDANSYPPLGSGAVTYMKTTNQLIETLRQRSMPLKVKGTV